MKYLKRYNESFEELEYKIKECFVGVSDMDINIKYDGYTVNSRSSVKKHGHGAIGREFVILKIGLDDRVTSAEEETSKWGVKYRPVINGKEIAFEISNAIQHCIGYDLNVNWACVRWKNAGEWNESGKSGLGPGLLEKAFSKNGVTRQFENPIKGNYNLEDLFDFIESKGDMLRTIEIHFTE
jgi:hypothetical protein